MILPSAASTFAYRSAVRSPRPRPPVADESPVVDGRQEVPGPERRRAAPRHVRDATRRDSTHLNALLRVLALRRATRPGATGLRDATLAYATRRYVTRRHPVVRLRHPKLRDPGPATLRTATQLQAASRNLARATTLYALRDAALPWATLRDAAARCCRSPPAREPSATTKFPPGAESHPPPTASCLHGVKAAAGMEDALQWPRGSLGCGDPRPRLFPATGEVGVSSDDTRSCPGLHILSDSHSAARIARSRRGEAVRGVGPGTPPV